MRVLHLSWLLLAVAVADPRAPAQAYSPPSAQAVNPSPTPASPAAAAPKSPKPDFEERFAASIETTMGSLEKVIQMQANQISIFSWMVGIFGILLTLAGFGLYRALLTTIRDAVDDRVSALVANGIDTQNARSVKLHSVFLETTFSASQDIAISRHRELLRQANSGELDLTTAQGVESFAKLQSEVLLFPLSIVALTYALAAADEDPGVLREKAWVLFAEVAAGTITPQRMLVLIAALHNVLEHRQTKTVVLDYLRRFSAQMKEAVRTRQLPTAPDF